MVVMPSFQQQKLTCESCGNPLITVIPGALYRCSVCGLYRRIRPKPNIASPETKQVVGNAREEPVFVTLTGELKIFAERVIYTLCPPEKGYAPVIVKEIKKIYDVLEGKGDFADWFTKVRQMLSLKNYQLAKTLYDCLEGLRSEEAKQLRQEWLSYLSSEMKGYGLV
jgi:hypothetical protein